MAVRTGQKRPGTLMTRGLMFFGALMAIPFGLYGVIAQHAVGAGIAAFLGLLCLALWWVLRPRFSGRRVRRLAAACSLLTMAVAAAAVVGFVEFLASPSYGASVSTLRPAIIAGAVAVTLLLVRLLAGHRLRVLVAAEAAAAPAATQPGAAGTSAVPETEWAEQARRAAENQISELQQRWRSGQYQSTPCLTVQPDGTLVLRPRRLRAGGWRRGTVGALPFALVALARTFVTAGWVGLLVVAASVALILLALLGLYERRIRHGAAVLTETEVIIPTWYGRRRSVPRSAVVRVALVQQQVPRQATATPRLLFVGGDGNCLLRLATTTIPLEDVLAFAAALLVPVDVPPQRMELYQLAQQYPGSVSGLTRHPAAYGLLIAVIIVIIVVGVVVGLAVAGVISGSSGQPG